MHPEEHSKEERRSQEGRPVCLYSSCVAVPAPCREFKSHTDGGRGWPERRRRRHRRLKGHLSSRPAALQVLTTDRPRPSHQGAEDGLRQEQSCPPILRPVASAGPCLLGSSPRHCSQRRADAFLQSCMTPTQTTRRRRARCDRRFRAECRPRALLSATVRSGEASANVLVDATGEAGSNERTSLYGTYLCGSPLPGTAGRRTRLLMCTPAFPPVLVWHR